MVWGRGSTFPFSDRDDLNDAVIGRRTTPSPPACFAVAGALTVAGALVADVPGLPRGIQRLGVTGVAAVLATRAGLGFTGRTDLASPGSVSTRFRRLDRRVLLATLPGARRRRTQVAAPVTPVARASTRTSSARCASNSSVVECSTGMASRSSWSSASPRTTL